MGLPRWPWPSPCGGSEPVAGVEILAAVTDGNMPSERMLTSIGFDRVAAL